MTGSIQKKKGIYYLVLSTGKDAKSKKYKTRWIRSGPDERAAELELARLLIEQEQTRFLNPEKITVKEFFTRWLEDHVAATVRTSTYESYKWTTDTFITPYLGPLELKTVTPLHIQDMFGRLRRKHKKLSKTTLHYVYSILRAALNRAVKWRLILVNPALAIDPPKKEKYRSRAYTAEQLATLLDAAKDTPLYLPVLLASSCGLRRGECCGLRWDDVDFENRTLRVRNSLSYSGAGKAELQSVKTQQSERAVRLPDKMLELLLSTSAQQAADKLKAGPLYNKLNYVWAFDDGSRHDPSNLTHNFLKLIRSCDLPEIRFHDLRHTHATMLLREHVPVKTISERLGHSSTTITQDLYSHVLPEMQQEAADAMDRILDTPAPKKAADVPEKPKNIVVNFRPSKLPKKNSKKKTMPKRTAKSVSSPDAKSNTQQKTS